MRSAYFLGAAALSSVAMADISIDVNEADKVATDVEGFVAQVTGNPAFTSDIAAIESAIPASVIQAAEANPEAFVEAIVTATALPSWISAIPTSAIDSLETILAKPINAVEDLGSYIESVVNEPVFSSVASVLATGVPASVQKELEADPASFFEGIITATAPPAYITALPQDVQSDVGSFINEGLSILASDLEASTTPSIAPFAKPTLTKQPSAGTGSAYSTGAYGNSTVPFTGAANSVVVNTIGAGVLAAAGAVLALL